MDRRVLFILLGVIAFFLVLGFGAVAGGAATYFALQAKPVKAALAAQTVTNQDREGLLVASVEPDSPAEQAGLVRGDILTEVNGETINQAKDLFDILTAAQAGDTLALNVLHGDDAYALSVILGERDGRAYLGIRLCSQLPADVRLLPREFENLDFTGAMIREVVPDSPADQVGLGTGEVILSVDGQALDADTDLAEVIQSNEPGDTITLEVRQLQDDESREVEVTLGENPDQEGQAYLGVQYLPWPNLHPFEGEGQPFRFFLQPDSGGEGFILPHMPFEDLPFAPGLPQLPEEIERAVIVAEVTPDSPAEAAGLEKSDLITAVNGEAVDEPQALAEIIRSHEPGDEITLTVYRQGEEDPMAIKVRLAENPDKPGETYLGVRIGGFMRFQRDQ